MGVLLCKYGIEYVDDERTAAKVPTCHRTNSVSIFDNSNFVKTLDCSIEEQKEAYLSEARIIDDIQKKILDIASKEDPYDVFICYKETDKEGNRTIDSILAQDLFNVLTSKGYKVFFSRITLEDKLGVEYEPYIYSTLSTAKVMLAIGNNEDNFNAVWVKNEWSRYLSIKKMTRLNI